MEKSLSQSSLNSRPGQLSLLSPKIMYAFLALDAEKVAIQHLDDAEEIEVCPTPLEEVVRMAKEGEFSALQVAVLFYALVHMNRID
jgi:hypothetical protein